MNSVTRASSSAPTGFVRAPPCLHHASSERSGSGPVNLITLEACTLTGEVLRHAAHGLFPGANRAQQDGASRPEDCDINDLILRKSVHGQCASRTRILSKIQERNER